MKRALGLFAAISLIPAALFSASNFKFKKDLLVAENSTYEYNVISLGGDIDIKGKFKHTVILFGGSLNLDGETGEDIICFGSKVSIGKSALVKGDLFVIGGRLDKDPGAEVKGEFTYFRFDLKKIESSLIPILSDRRTVTFFKILRIFLWLIISLVVLAVVPRKINAAEEVLETHPLKIGILGLLSLLCFIFLVIIFLLLSFVIIGIPLLFIAILAYFVIYIFGRTVIFYTIGDKLASAMHLKKTPPSLFIVFGVVLYFLLMFLPVVGPVLLILINVFELGVGVGFILRKRLRLAGR